MMLEGFLLQYSLDVLIVGFGLIMMALLFIGVPLWVWSLGLLLALQGFGVLSSVYLFVLPVLLILNLSFIRRYVVSFWIMKGMQWLKFLPVISQTEKDAIEAGNVWMDAELFSGKPNFKTLLSQPYPVLTQEEKAFLDGPVNTLCEMVNDWQVHRSRQFSKETWDYLKKEKFFGMIIPKQYSGLGFSANAHSAVIQKLSSRSTPLGITVMVPNSLGPAELLVHYGTEEQKNYYLPRLASGEEIPCFALTESGAGSDAGAMSSYGVVFKGQDGDLYIRLNWKKRYITLASISTLLGLAFKLKDPENLLGKGVNVGITCALIPTSTKGVVIGRRHDPLGVPFYNCPTQGQDVIIPIKSVIGGKEGVGRGWKMLMECLAAGRGISLPANCAGGAKLVARVATAYSAVRKQFGLSIRKFEGIEEPLARIVGFSYLLEALRAYTCGGIDAGAKPPVVTAIAKYNATELFRDVINDGMDILGGAAISMGPRNLLAHPYFAAPISITVEGANILTRTLIIFGQGAMRCHPYAFQEVAAIESGDIKKFDQAFFKHIGHVIRNKWRYILLSLTRGYLAFVPVYGKHRRYAQKLSWASAQFAYYADIAMATLGGDLKRKEKITGRFADILSWMYISSAILRRYEAEGRKHSLEMSWSLDYAFAQIQKGFEGILSNMGWIYKSMLWWQRINPIGSLPSDKLGNRLLQDIFQNQDSRDALTEGIYQSKQDQDSLHKLETAFQLLKQTEPLTKVLSQAIKSGKIKKGLDASTLSEVIEKGILSKEEVELLQKADEYIWDVIQVDDYSEEAYLNRAFEG